MPLPFPSSLALSAPSVAACIGWVALALHVAGILLALHSLLRTRSPQGTMAWILGLVTFPYIAIPLYLALGVARIRRHTEQEMADCGAERLQPMLAPHRVEGGIISRMLERCCGYPLCGGNSIRLLRDGEDTYPVLEQAVREARSFIMVEFFIIRDDRVGSALRELLEARARDGLAVYVIYDELGSHKLPNGYLRRLRRAGVKVASFNGRRFWWSSFLRINYRNHRKLVVIDGELAYLGSLNVGQEYSRRNSWRDTFLSLRGPAVGETMQSFLHDWYRATGENINAGLPVHAEPAGTECCQLIPSGPDDGSTSYWHLAVQELAAHARKRLWLATPYFTPTEAVYSALQGAALRGVDVRILVPQKSDNRMANLALLTYQRGLISRGVKMLGYTPGVLHEKVAVMDDMTSTVGSANLDERSLRLNFELTLFMEGREMNERVAAMLEEDMRHSTPLAADAWERAGWPVRLGARICRLLSPVL